MAKAKVVVFYSPLEQTGKTTLANMLGLGFAEKGKKVLIIELAKVGYSITLNQRMDEEKRSLYKALLNPDSAAVNVIQSRLSKNLFLLCQNCRCNILELLQYNAENIDTIVEEFIDSFDYIFIDLPSNITDVGTTHIMGDKFKFPVSHTFVVVTENLQCYRMLNDTSILFNEASKSIKTLGSNVITFVINKSRDIYKEYIVDYLKDIPKYEVSNVVSAPYHELLEVICNEGTINSLGKTPISKEFISSLEIMEKIIENNLVGVGTGKKKKENSKDKKLKANAKDSLELDKNEMKKAKKSSKKDKKEKPKKNKKNKKVDKPQVVSSENNNMEEIEL